MESHRQSKYDFIDSQITKWVGDFVYLYTHLESLEAVIRHLLIHKSNTAQRRSNDTDRRTMVMIIHEVYRPIDGGTHP